MKGATFQAVYLTFISNDVSMPHRRRRFLSRAHRDFSLRKRTAALNFFFFSFFSFFFFCD